MDVVEKEVVFIEESKHGIETPKRGIDLRSSRLRSAAADYDEWKRQV